MLSDDRSKSIKRYRSSRPAGFWKFGFHAPGRSWTDFAQGEKQGQALVLLAVSFFALLAFIGLVTDVGSIYVSYTQLQRAVDSAAVSAANNIKNKSDPQFRLKIVEATKEFLLMHNVSNLTDLQVYLCSDKGKTDASGNPYVLPPSFDNMCSLEKRKLAYIEASQASPVYFLQLFGVRSFPVHVSAVGETAAVDLVMVIDTSESMASEMEAGVYKTTGYDPYQYNPNLAGTPPGCNINNTCYPLKDAKDAAQSLVANLFAGYDKVAVVTFNYTATLVVGLTDELTNTVPTAINDYINLHDDLDGNKVRWIGASAYGDYRTYNHIYPEDRDGDGKDRDDNMTCTDNVPVGGDGWDDTASGDDTPLGDPCDSDTIADAIDWDWTGSGPHHFDGAGAPGWYGPDVIPSSMEETSLLSTCSGCGIRVGTETLMAGGRPGAVWVIVYLSDGVTNLSDTHGTYSEIPSDFIYGFCGPTPFDTATSFWDSGCIDWDGNPPNAYVPPGVPGRYCIDDDPDNCPTKIDSLGFPNYIIADTATSGPYSVEDYAFDMVDRAALTFKYDLIDIDTADPHYSATRREPMGEDIVIFSVGLSPASSGGINLLHYLANIGDEGSRDNDVCAGFTYNVSCGNYYYAPKGAYLSRIFENIAGRIFTKISR